MTIPTFPYTSAAPTSNWCDHNKQPIQAYSEWAVGVVAPLGFMVCGLKAFTHIQPRLHIFAGVHGGGLIAEREANSGLGLPLVAVLPIKA